MVGVDSSAPMLAIAGRRVEGRENAELLEGEATALPVADGDFDAAVSVQVFEYVDEIPAALGEIRRALRPGGRIVLWDVDWTTMSLRTADEARMERILAAWDEHLADPALPRRLTAELRAAGFEDPRVEGHSFATNELIDDTYGGFVVPFLEQYVIDAGTADEADARAWADEQRELAERGEFYFAVTQLCFTATAQPERPGAARKTTNVEMVAPRATHSHASARGLAPGQRRAKAPARTRATSPPCRRPGRRPCGRACCPAS